MSFSRYNAYQAGPPLAARGQGIRTPNAQTIMRDRLSPNREGKWEIPSHLFIAVLRDGVPGFLPESTVEKEFTDTKGFLTLEQLFTKGDELYLVEPHVRVEFAGATQGATVMFQLAGYSATYTWQALFGTSPQRFAMDVKAFIDKDPYLSKRLSVVLREAGLYLFSKDGVSEHNLTITVSGGTATKTPTAGMAPLTKFGKITAIDRSGEVTLAEPVPFPIPVGANVGCPVQQVIGYHPHPTNWMNTQHMALTAIEQGTIRINDMPYWRDGIMYQWLPNLRPDISYVPAFN
jgi:hypothetical protein